MRSLFLQHFEQIGLVCKLRLCLGIEILLDEALGLLEDQVSGWGSEIEVDMHWQDQLV